MNYTEEMGDGSLLDEIVMESSPVRRAKLIQELLLDLGCPKCGHHLTELCDCECGFSLT